MEVFLGILIGIGSIVGIVMTRYVTTFFHEMGHAISALFLTKNDVEVYIGSYGDIAKSLRLKLGKFTLYFSFIIWDMDMGLCSHVKTDSDGKQMFIILSGPVLSLLLAVLMLYIMISSSLSDGLIFILSIFALSFVWDFFVNLIPRKSRTILKNGLGVYNDGMQLLNLYRHSRRSEEDKELEQLLEEGEYARAEEMANAGLSEYPNSRFINEILLEAIYKQNRPKDFLKQFDDYIEKFNPDVRLVKFWAKEKIKLHEYDDVVSTLTKIIYDGKGNYDLQFLRGKALIELGEYYDAMRDFHALTLGDVEDPRALANRAYCQYRLGYEEEAREDVQQAVNHAKSYKGEIYFLAGVIFENHDEEKALAFYKKAEALKYDHHALAFNISRIEKFK